MKRVFAMAGLAAVLLTSLGTMQASAAYEFYMKVTGTKQGTLKGESTRAAWQGQAPCISMAYEVKAVTDLATGLSTGKVQYMPLTVTKEWGASSPQLFQASVTGEALKEVTLSFVKTSPQGAEEVYFTIQLKNAVIVSYRMRAGEAARGTADAAAHQAANDTHELEDITFRYESITMTSVLGGTGAMGGEERTGLRILPR